MCHGHSSGVKPHVLGDGESLGTIFRSLRSTWQSRMGWRGCRGSRMTSRSESLTWGVIRLLNMLKTWFCGQNPCFGWWGILWDNFQEPHADVRCLEWDVYFGTKNTTDFHPQGKTKLQFHSMRSWASHFCSWHPDHGLWHQSHIYSMFRSWQPQVRISLLEVLLASYSPSTLFWTFWSIWGC